MTITYYGLTCFKIEVKGTVLTINPFSKDSGLSPPRFETNINIVTKSSYIASKIGSKPYNISGPGEYDISGINIKGINLTKDHTAYVIEWDNIKLMHLGEFETGTAKEINETLKEIVDNLDILFIPVGGKLGSARANDLINLVEPKVVIPMFYAIKGAQQKLEKLKDFLKERGDKYIEEDKLSIKKKDLIGKEKEIIVLKSPYAIL